MFQSLYVLKPLVPILMPVLACRCITVEIKKVLPVGIHTERKEFCFKTSFQCKFWPITWLEIVVPPSPVNAVFLGKQQLVGQVEAETHLGDQCIILKRILSVGWRC